MTLTALAFAAGAAALQLQAELPALAWLLVLPGCLAGIYCKPRLAAPLAFLIGFLWAAAMAHVRMADWLAPELEGSDDVVEVPGTGLAGVVAAERALPAVDEHGAGVERVDSQDGARQRALARARRAQHHDRFGGPRVGPDGQPIGAWTVVDPTTPWF